MDGERILGYLRELCRDLDLGATPLAFRVWKGARRAALPVAIAFSAGSAGCPSQTSQQQVVVLYGAPAPVEICDDGQDNDGDGLADCADTGCADYESCLPQEVMEYAAPMEEPSRPAPAYAVQTSDDDPEEIPQTVAEYAAVFEE